MAASLTPIPVSQAQRWQVFRRQGMPIVMFVVAVIGAAGIWQRWVSPPTFIAEAEIVHTEVRSPAPGWLSGLQVDLFRAVKAGETLGHVIKTDPKLLESSLAVVRAELELMLASMEPIIAQQRVALDFERLQLEWMRQRVELVALRSELTQAEAEFVRVQSLHEKKLVAEQDFESAKLKREAIAQQLAEQTKLVATLEPRLAAFSETTASTPLASPQAALRATIKLQEEQLRLTERELGPVALTAPADGIISSIFRRSGEAIVAGEPIIQISNPDPTRLIAFVRQPLPFEPKAGMTVALRKRSLDRATAPATILQVGREMEPIYPTLLNAMRLTATTVPTELGLRVHLNVPAALRLRPGEQVDAIVREN